jgi:hypothetical protein
MMTTHDITPDAFAIQWRDVPGYEGKYQVSASGDVRRIGGGGGSKHGRIRKQTDHKAGYKAVSLSSANQGRSFLVHRIVISAFLGPIPDGYEVNHINGVKTDNRIENLEFVTRAENIRHAMDTGLINNIGSDNPTSKLTEAQVAEIRILHAGGTGYKNLGRKYGVSWECIRNIIKGRSWKAQGAANG